jgi:hypothetical protein
MTRPHTTERRNISTAGSSGLPKTLWGGIPLRYLAEKQNVDISTRADDTPRAAQRGQAEPGRHPRMGLARVGTQRQGTKLYARGVTGHWVGLENDSQHAHRIRNILLPSSGTSSSLPIPLPSTHLRRQLFRCRLWLLSYPPRQPSRSRPSACVEVLSFCHTAK